MTVPAHDRSPFSLWRTLVGRPNEPRSWGVRVAILAALVLVAHVLMLERARVAFYAQKNTPNVSFNTRTIELPAEVKPPPPEPPKPPPVKPKPKPIPKPVPPKPQPAPVPTPSPAPAAANPSPESPEGLSGPSANVGTAGSTPPEGATPVTPPTAPAVPEAQPALPPAPPAVVAILDPVRLKYDVVGQRGTTPYRGGVGEIVWQHDGSQYAMQLKASASILFFKVDLLTQSSVGQLTETGLAPKRFGNVRYRKAEQAAHFERDKGKIIFSANTPEVVLVGGMQDRLSVIMQLAAMLAADPAKYPANSSIAVPTVSARDADTWTFTVQQLETLELPTGKLEAVHVIRNPRREFDQKVELWFAPGMKYLPVRLRLTEANGDFFDTQWRSSEAISPLPPG